jgi:hypothetical protein
LYSKARRAYGGRMSTVIAFPEVSKRDPLAAVASAEVRSLMGRYGVTQMMLAEWLSIDQTAVSARLRGKTEWKLAEIERVAEWFAVHPAVLLGGRAEGPHPSPDGGLPIVRACRDSNPKPSDPKVVVTRLAAA